MCLCSREGGHGNRKKQGGSVDERTAGRHAWLRAPRGDDLWPLVESTALSLLTGGTRDFKPNSTLKENSAAAAYTRRSEGNIVNLREEVFPFVAPPPLVCTCTSLTMSRPSSSSWFGSPLSPWCCLFMEICPEGTEAGAGVKKDHLPSQNSREGSVCKARRISCACCP